MTTVLTAMVLVTDPDTVRKSLMQKKLPTSQKL
jgi:hypothetical protein